MENKFKSMVELAYHKLKESGYSPDRAIFFTEEAFNNEKQRLLNIEIDSYDEQSFNGLLLLLTEAKPLSKERSDQLMELYGFQ